MATNFSAQTPCSSSSHRLPIVAQLEMGWRDYVRMVGNPEAIRLDVVANSWNGRGIGREHRSNHRGALCGDIGSEGPGTWTAGCFRVSRDPTRGGIGESSDPDLGLLAALLAAIRQFSQKHHHAGMNPVP